MNYSNIVEELNQLSDVEESTMMKTPCLRYKGEFLCMYFDKADSLIIKVSAERVDEIIAEGLGNEFNFTKKRFKEWVLIPSEFEEKYIDFALEALDYAKSKKD